MSNASPGSGRTRKQRHFLPLNPQSPIRDPQSQRIGFHVSIAGGLWRAVGRAIERGCTAFQIFCGNPRGWKLRRRSPEEVERLKASRAAADLTPLFVHSCYLINPCSPRRPVFRRSVSRLAAELESAAAIGADYYVLHPGTHKGRPADWGVERAAKAIVAALRQADSSPPLLLESMAGPHGPGGDLSTLGQLIARIQQREPAAHVGVAVDSCHVFGAGYDLRKQDEVERLTEGIEREIGLGRLHLIHVNDSRDEPGSRRDRHYHIGKGAIGNRGLRNFLNHPAFSGLPLILETPWESVKTDRRNLRAVLKLLEAR